MYQFFIQPCQAAGHEVTIIGDDVNHIKNVLRMKIGEEIAAIDQETGNEYRCEIEELEEDIVRCRLLFVKENGVELPAKIYLFQGLPKNDKMELIIQKAVELGAYQIIPLATKRAVVKLDAKKEASKLSRWNSISESAAKQSKRRMVPEVTKVMTIKEAIAYCQDFEVKLIPYELTDPAAMSTTRQIIEGIKQGQSVAVFIGPEGGFEEAEVGMTQAAGFQPITLGHRILRTETAGFTVLSWLMYHLEP